MSGVVNGIRRPDSEHRPATELVEIVVTEELDLAAVRELGGVLDSILALRPARLVIDVAACRYVDAAGIGLLLDVHRRMWRLGGRLTLRSPSPRLHRLLQVARVDQVFHVIAPRGAAECRGGPRHPGDQGMAGKPGQP